MEVLQVSFPAILPRRSTASSSENNFFYRSYKSLTREILRWSLDQLISQLRRKDAASSAICVLLLALELCQMYILEGRVRVSSIVSIDR